MRDPRFVLRSPRPGKGAQRPQEAPRPSPAARRRSAAVRPHRGSQGPPAGLGGAEGGAAARGYSARREKRSASRRGG